MALVAAMAFFGLWMAWLGPMFFQPPQPTTQPAQGQGEPPAPPAATQPAPTATQSDQPERPAVATQSVAPGRIVAVVPSTQPDEADLVLGSLEESDGYLLRVLLTPRGAGVRSAQLTEYFRTTRDRTHYTVLGDEARQSEWPADLATTEVRLRDQAVPLSGPVWQALPERPAVENGQGLTLVARLTEDGQPLLDLHKTFTLTKGSYELGVSYRLVNRSGAPLELSLSDAGLTVPLQEGTRDERQLIWAQKPKDRETPESKPIGRAEVIKDPKEVKLPSTTADVGLVWAAAVNKFFGAVVRPLDPRQRGLTFSAVALGSDQEHSRFRVEWKAEGIAVPADPNAPVELAFSDFIGPKSRKLFTENKDYVRLNYEKLISYGSCALCMFEPLIGLMLWLLDVLHFVVRNYGLAIMILVGVVRVLLHPLTKKSQMSMSKMSKLQPKMEEIKKQYANDRAEQNKAMAEFYRQQGLGAVPILGCAPMLLQMPIWVALWGGLNASIELRHAPFFWWINDLAAPDALYAWTTPAQGFNLPLIGGMLGPVYAFNLLPVLLMIAMLFQQMLTPKPATGPSAGQQKFMMYFMTVFFGVLFYNMPSGLTLYVMASTAVGVGEQYVIRKHIREQEEAEARGELPKKKERPLPAPRSRSRNRR